MDRYTLINLIVIEICIISLKFEIMFKIIYNLKGDRAQNIRMFLSLLNA